MEGGEKVNEYESMQKKVDKLIREKSEEKASEKNQEMKICEEYKSEREKISKQLMKLEAKNRINGRG